MLSKIHIKVRYGITKWQCGQKHLENVYHHPFNGNKVKPDIIIPFI